MTNTRDTGFPQDLLLLQILGARSCSSIIEILLRQLLFSRAMLHDEAIYPKPFEFNPDRFMKDGELNPDIRDPGHAVFGFGRRHAFYCCYSSTF
jgi:hypothetical protein